MKIPSIYENRLISFNKKGLHECNNLKGKKLGELRVDYVLFLCSYRPKSQYRMQIEYNAQQKTLSIKDGLKTQYLLVKAMMGVLLINAVIIIVTASKTGFGTLDYVWVVFGLIASYTLYNLIFKKSTQQEIATKDIDHLRIRHIRGKSHFSLVLKNGKTRNLAVLSNDKEEQQMIQLFNKVGVQKK